VNVLVVEPEPDTSAFLTNLLSNWGYNVAVAPSVDSAMTLLENFRFDAVVSDLSLGGETLTAEAKRRQPWTVAVALGASGEAVERESERTKGFEHYLAKPVDPQALHALLAAA
jgi:two-component system sensor histidine kinase EvgS